MLYLKPAVTFILAADLAAGVIDLPQLIDVATRIGSTGLLTLWLWMMLTDRLHTAKRVAEANTRAEGAEKQRDTAFDIARGQVEATKELAQANRQVLDFVRDRFAAGRARR